MNLHTQLFLAYVDPGTGSLILQMIIAGIVGVVAFFRNSIFGIFKRRSPNKNPNLVAQVITLSHHADRMERKLEADNPDTPEANSSADADAN